MKKIKILIVSLLLLFYSVPVYADSYYWQETGEAIDSASDQSIENDNYKIECWKGGVEGYLCKTYIKRENSNNSSEKEETNTSNENINYCTGLHSTFVFLGHIVRIAKILIPIVIIAFGMLDFFNGVIASKDDEIKKAIRSLIFRALSGVCIFFLPAVIDLVFSWVDGWQDNYESSYKECFQCIWNVGECTKD